MENRRSRLLLSSSPVCFLLIGSLSLFAAKPSQAPEALLSDFSQNWTESLWGQKSPFRPKGYMQPTDARGWQVRMATIQGLVAQREAAIPLLREMLKTGEKPQRILAAQVLGYLGPDVPRDVLLEAAKNDEEAAVRLYAVDALGMAGDAETHVDWKALLAVEENRDVKKHINYAIERKNQPVEEEIIRNLVEWDIATIDSAAVGKPAPDFQLTSANGETIRLSDYRGKKPVVLVFIYGDT